VSQSEQRFIHITRNGAQTIVTWDDGILQSADDVTGPWSDVPGATSPHVVNTGAAGRKFYRLR